MDSITAPKRPNTRDKKYVYVLGSKGEILNYRWFRYADEYLISAYVKWATGSLAAWDNIYSIFSTPSVTTFFHMSYKSSSVYDWLPFKRRLEENGTLLAQRRCDGSTSLCFLGHK